MGRNAGAGALMPAAATPLGAVSRGVIADEFSRESPSQKAQISAKSRHLTPPHSKTTPFQPVGGLITRPVGRAAKGAAVAEVLLQLGAVLEAGRPGFIVFTVLWRRVLDITDDDRDVARHQAALVHRTRRVLGRRGVRSPFILSTLEKTDRHGLHGHIVAECPKALHRQVLDIIETGLARRYGPLPPRTFNRDGRYKKGSIASARAAIGAVAYRLKSLPAVPAEHGVRRGVGLLPIEGITVRCSSGRSKPPAQP